jgi:tetratricopeptide (TPR) repeat protein
MSWRVALLISFTLGLRSSWLAAQTLSDAESQLARGDTSRAIVCDPHWFRPAFAWDSAGGRDSTIARLQAAARAAPDDGEKWLALGLYRTFTSSERSGAWRDRVETEHILNRALQLLRGDPRPLAALGVLWLKQGVRVDARRAIQRALSLARRSGAALDPCLEAELHYQLALINRASWEDREGMVSMIGGVGTLKRCPYPTRPRYDGEPEEFHCPAQFYDIMSHRADLTWMRYDDRDAMITNLEAAVAANPGHRAARRGLLLALFELRDWERFDRALEGGLAADSADPWLQLWGATAAYARRDIDGADRFTHQALRLLPSDERDTLLSPVRIISSSMANQWVSGYDSIYWRAADPLLLTATNERLLAHVARVTYASSKYDVPALETRGPDTDAGNLLVRYGQPWKRWQVSFDHLLQGTMSGGGRELVWAFDSLTPPIRLSRALTMRRWRLGEVSGQLYQALPVPQRFDPREAFDLFDSLPVQVARFEEGGHTVLDVYALWENPYEDLVPDTVRIGFFLNDAAMNRLLDRRRTVTHRKEPLPLRFRAPFDDGWYAYRVETLSGPGRAAGRARGSLRVTAPHPDSLRTSDLLLGRRLGTRPITIRHRDTLRIDPLYNLEVGPEDSTVVYWETYGLRPDSGGVVRYRVGFDVREADRGAVGTILASLAAGLGLARRRGLSLEWDVEAPAPDGIRRDVLALGPTGWPVGTYTLRVRIEEAGSGRVAVTERRVRLREHKMGPVPDRSRNE